ncbi:MAG: bifunctional hydroxymethylpyrimidine kinase/phosphomethylpyrimidine kinase [Caulobacteraceae bacterium]
MREDRGRVLIIAGSDSGGGAGLQADIKTVTMLGGYAATAITAITVQNTLGVLDVFPIPPEVVLAQGRAVLDDIGADALKVGMLGGAVMAEVAAELIERAGDAPAVVDPVMTAKGGAALMAAEALAVLRERVFPRTALLTPNAPEAAALTGRPVETEDDQRRAGEALLDLGVRAVLMKGGHIEGPRVVDILMTGAGTTRFESGRIDTRHTHGTGCTLASAIATGLSHGESLEHSVERAHDYVQAAIRHAPGFGAGHGPLGHNWRLRTFD